MDSENVEEEWTNGDESDLSTWSEEESEIDESNEKDNKGEEEEKEKEEEEESKESKESKEGEESAKEGEGEKGETGERGKESKEGEGEEKQEEEEEKKVSKEKSKEQIEKEEEEEKKERERRRKKKKEEIIEKMKDEYVIPYILYNGIFRMRYKEYYKMKKWYIGAGVLPVAYNEKEKKWMVLLGCELSKYKEYLNYEEDYTVFSDFGGYKENEDLEDPLRTALREAKEEMRMGKTEKYEREYILSQENINKITSALKPPRIEEEEEEEEEEREEESEEKKKEKLREKLKEGNFTLAAIYEYPQYLLYQDIGIKGVKGISVFKHYITYVVEIDYEEVPEKYENAEKKGAQWFSIEELEEKIDYNSCSPLTYEDIGLATMECRRESCIRWPFMRILRHGFLEYLKQYLESDKKNVYEWNIAVKKILEPTVPDEYSLKSQLRYLKSREKELSEEVILGTAGTAEQQYRYWMREYKKLEESRETDIKNPAIANAFVGKVPLEIQNELLFRENEIQSLINKFLENAIVLVYKKGIEMDPPIWYEIGSEEQKKELEKKGRKGEEEFKMNEEQRKAMEKVNFLFLKKDVKELVSWNQFQNEIDKVLEEHFKFAMDIKEGKIIKFDPVSFDPERDVTSELANERSLEELIYDVLKMKKGVEPEIPEPKDKEYIRELLGPEIEKGRADKFIKRFMKKYPEYIHEIVEKEKRKFSKELISEYESIVAQRGLIRTEELIYNLNKFLKPIKRVEKKEIKKKPKIIMEKDEEKEIWIRLRNQLREKKRYFNILILVLKTLYKMLEFYNRKRDVSEIITFAHLQFPLIELQNTFKYVSTRVEEIAEIIRDYYRNLNFNMMDPRLIHNLKTDHGFVMKKQTNSFVEFGNRIVMLNRVRKRFLSLIKNDNNVIRISWPGAKKAKQMAYDNVDSFVNYINSIGETIRDKFHLPDINFFPVWTSVEVDMLIDSEDWKKSKLAYTPKEKIRKEINDHINFLNEYYRSKEKMERKEEQEKLQEKKETEKEEIQTQTQTQKETQKESEKEEETQETKEAAQKEKEQKERETEEEEGKGKEEEEEIRGNYFIPEGKVEIDVLEIEEPVYKYAEERVFPKYRTKNEKNVSILGSKDEDDETYYNRIDELIETKTGINTNLLISRPEIGEEEKEYEAFVEDFFARRLEDFEKSSREVLKKNKKEAEKLIINVPLYFRVFPEKLEGKVRKQIENCEEGMRAKKEQIGKELITIVKNKGTCKQVQGKDAVPVIKNVGSSVRICCEALENIREKYELMIKKMTEEEKEEMKEFPKSAEEYVKEWNAYRSRAFVILLNLYKKVTTRVSLIDDEINKMIKSNILMKESDISELYENLNNLIDKTKKIQDTIYYCTGMRGQRDARCADLVSILHWILADYFKHKSLWKKIIDILNKYKEDVIASKEEEEEEEEKGKKSVMRKMFSFIANKLIKPLIKFINRHYLTIIVGLSLTSSILIPMWYTIFNEFVSIEAEKVPKVGVVRRTFEYFGVLTASPPVIDLSASNIFIYAITNFIKILCSLGSQNYSARLAFIVALYKLGVMGKFYKILINILAWILVKGIKFILRGVTTVIGLILSYLVPKTSAEQEGEEEGAGGGRGVSSLYPEKSIEGAYRKITKMLEKFLTPQEIKDPSKIDTKRLHRQIVDEFNRISEEIIHNPIETFMQNFGYNTVVVLFVASFDILVQAGAKLCFSLTTAIKTVGQIFTDFGQFIKDAFWKIVDAFWQTGITGGPIKFFTTLFSPKDLNIDNSYGEIVSQVKFRNIGMLAYLDQISEYIPGAEIIKTTSSFVFNLVMNNVNVIYLIISFIILIDYLWNKHAKSKSESIADYEEYISGLMEQVKLYRRGEEEEEKPVFLDFTYIPPDMFEKEAKQERKKQKEKKKKSLKSKD